MEKFEKEYTLANPFNHPVVEMIIRLVGTEVTHTFEKWGEDDISFDGMEFESGETLNLMISGDDSWGAVTRVFMEGDHMIIVGNFGDDGDLYMCPTTSGEIEGFGHVNKLDIGDVIVYKDLVPQLKANVTPLVDIDLSIADLDTYPDMKDTWQKVLDHLGASCTEDVVSIIETDNEPDEIWLPDSYFTRIDRDKEMKEVDSPNFAHGCIVFGEVCFEGKLRNAVYTQNASPAAILINYPNKE